MGNTTAPSRDPRDGAVIRCWYVRLELKPEDDRDVVRLGVCEADRLLRVHVDVARLDKERRPAEAEVEAGAAIPADVGLGVLDRLGAIHACRIAGDAVRAGAAEEVEAARRSENRDIQLQTAA